MAYFKLINFNGIAPQVSPRLLGEGLGQTADNTDLDRGVLTPITSNSTSATLNHQTRAGLYRYDFGGTTYNLEFTNAVNVQPGPIADDAFDRLYWTGEGFPQMGSSTQLLASGSGAYPRSFFRLGIPAPANTATTSITAGSDDGTQTKYSTSYVYTFVSAFGEEGPPSAASTVLDKVDGQTVTISNMSTSTSKSNTNLANKRIYRSNTGSNTTNFQFVKEVTLATASTTDNLNNDALAEIIPSTYWIAPPDDDSSTYPNGQMLGLTAMANGIFAGFSGKRLCFSEPFLPHAWPVAYRITLEEEIVSIAMAGQVLFIATKGTPYIAAGTDPQSMSVVRMEAAQACLNKESLVDMGDLAIYASPDGLVGASGSDIAILTQGLITPKQWQAQFYPSTIKGFLWQGKYIGQYYTGSAYGAFMFDPRGGKNAFTTISSLATGHAQGGFTDPDDNELYLIDYDSGGGNAQVELFQGSTTNTTQTFKTSQFVLPKPTSMNFVKVEAEAYSGSGITVKVFGDGTEIFDATITASGSVFSAAGSAPTSFSATTIMEPILRLPTGVHKVYEVEVSGAHTINEICIGESIDELRAI